MNADNQLSVFHMKFDVVPIYSMLKDLQKLVVDRQTQPSIYAQSSEPSEMEKEKEVGHKWFYHACSYGSVNAVKFFIEILGYKADIRYNHIIIYNYYSQCDCSD